MKKKDFVNLLVGVVGGLLFALGMCMCLLPEWNVFRQGVVVTAVGAAVLIVLAVANWVKSGKSAKAVNWKLVGKIAYGVFAALVLGVGMCLVLVWKLILPGILVGALGIVLLLCLIPMTVGLK